MVFDAITFHLLGLILIEILLNQELNQYYFLSSLLNQFTIVMLLVIGKISFKQMLFVI
jgi:hypothetical protein